MYTAKQVSDMFEEWTKPSYGYTKAQLACKIAEACMGWSYVWGADGQLCTPINRKSFSQRSSCPPDEAKVIIKKCKSLSGANTCNGCQWYPNEKTRFFDCRGFTRWILKLLQIIIEGSGATSQYNTNSNWTEKGEIKNMPTDCVCCVFQFNKNKKNMQHTGLYVGNGRIIHCSGTVKEDSIKNTHWTHYAIPVGIGGDTPIRPTLRRGSKGEAVKEAQQLLINKGYSVGTKGADGIFGNATLKAVKAFQKACGIKVDGIIGKNTWNYLLKS